MATRVDGRTRGDGVRGVSYRAHGVDETKAAFTEFMAYLATVAAVLIASAIDDAIDGRLAWILVAALGSATCSAAGWRSRAAATAKETTSSSFEDGLPAASEDSGPFSRHKAMRASFRNHDDDDMSLICDECKKTSGGEREPGWQAHLVDLDENGQYEVVFFCPECAAQEFGST